MVLLLEDLHWSRSDSLKLLQGCPLTGAAPLLVVATYRDDERPRLGDELPGVERIDLARLPEHAIAELAVAMIGEAGRAGDRRLLARETEGNAFFVVEVVRALAEEAGGLDKIGTATLPEKVFAGGIRRVVQRRLQRLSGEARALLRTAAVIGRTIDAKLVLALSPDVDLDAWLSRCVEAAVLERAGEELRFAHDKLREGLLAEIGDAERRRLHGQVGEAIERVYPDAPERYAALAHHFGEHADAAKESRYATLAGEQALRNAAFLEGMKLLRRALDLDASGEASPLDRAHCLRLLGDAEFYSGNLTAANLHLAESMRLLGHAPPRSSLAWVVLIVSQLLVQIALRLAPGRGSPRPLDPGLLEASKAAGRMANIGAFMLDGPRVFGLSLLGVNLAERGGGADIAAMAMLGYAAGALHLRGTARRYLERGRALALAESRPSDFFFVVYIGAVFHAGNGNLDAAVALIREAHAAALRIGDVLYTAMAEGGLGEIEGLRGNLAGRYHHWHSAQGRLDSFHGDHRVGYVTTMADALALLGRFGEAERALARVADGASPRRPAGPERDPGRPGADPRRPGGARISAAPPPRPACARSGPARPSPPSAISSSRAWPRRPSRAGSGPSTSAGPRPTKSPSSAGASSARSRAGRGSTPSDDR